MEEIHVTKTALPPLEEYQAYVEQIWQSGRLTNQGPLLQQFETEVKDFLNVADFQFVSNGTIALQLALRSLGITEGEVITTPFSYVATTSAIVWEHCTPVYVDIDPETFCINVNKIEAAITPNTKAILAVHVFGSPCDTDRIEAIATKHNLSVIYDGAHAFGVMYKGKSLLGYGDISTCSFHATKVFHTIEGGAVITADSELNRRLDLMKHFGHIGDNHDSLGINAKSSEFQAAMGLCNLQYVEAQIAKRKVLAELYDVQLNEHLQKLPNNTQVTKHNYAYYPVVLPSEALLEDSLHAFKAENIFPRRYFYPSLNRLPYIKNAAACPVSEDIARRVLCLPLYGDLNPAAVSRIAAILNKMLA